ncbi:hypothetical protein V8C26DRAFT_399458 [Trichoderma gracile]
MASAIGFPIWRATFPKHTGRVSDPMLLFFASPAVGSRSPGQSSLSSQALGQDQHQPLYCTVALSQQAGIDSAGLLGASE